MPTSPLVGTHVKQRDLKLGDIVSFEFSSHRFDCAKVIKRGPACWTLMRPHMSCLPDRTGDKSYPHVGFELMQAVIDSDKTWLLIDRWDGD